MAGVPETGEVVFHAAVEVIWNGLKLGVESLFRLEGFSRAQMNSWGLKVTAAARMFVRELMPVVVLDM